METTKCNNDFIEQYKILHASDFGFGNTSVMYKEEIKLFLDYLKPKSILDYGCEKGSLVNWLKENYSGIKIEGYDPAVEKYSTLPDEKFDLVICTDVLEHIPEDILTNEVIPQIAQISQNVYFGLHHEKASQILPNGENAHCTIKSPDWYKTVFNKHFSEVIILPGREYYLSTAITFKINKKINKKYYKLLSKYKTKTNSSIFEKIFSIKKDTDSTRITITVFGIKIKYKNNF